MAHQKRMPQTKYSKLLCRGRMINYMSLSQLNSSLSRLTYHSCMSRMWMSHVTHMKVSYHICECGRDLSHMWTRQIIHTNESWYACEWVMSHMRQRMSRIKHTNEPFPTLECHTHTHTHTYQSAPLVSDECRWKRHLRKRRTNKNRPWKETYYEHQKRSLKETCNTDLCQYFEACLCVTVCNLTHSYAWHESYIQVRTPVSVCLCVVHGTTRAHICASSVCEERVCCDSVSDRDLVLFH